MGHSYTLSELTPTIGTTISNICSPYAVASYNQFYPQNFKGLVANYFGLEHSQPALGILDLENGGEGLISTEGSAVI